MKKDKPFDLSEYQKVRDFKITSRENVEETVSVIITKIFYSDEFKIITHLFNGVKLLDIDNNTYFLLFDRKDLEKETEIQYSVGITIFKDIHAKRASNLITFIQAIIEKHLIPEYRYLKYSFIDENQNILGSINLDINKEMLWDTCLTIKNCLDNCLFLKCKNNPDIQSRLQPAKKIELELDSRLCPDTEPVRCIFHKIENKIEKEKKEVTERIESYYKNKKNRKNGITILHISDLHFTKDTNEGNQVHFLIKDLENVKFDSSRKLYIDYVVLSGDLSNISDPCEYQKVCKFLDELSAKYDISAEQIIIVPGNHDYSREITYKSYFIENFSNPKNKFDPTNDWKIDDKLYLKRNDKMWLQKFSNFDEYIYEYVYNEYFNPDPSKQFKVIKRELNNNQKIAFFMINTAVKIDHFYREEVYFDQSGLINHSRKVGNEYIKILVGHHPLNFANNIEFIHTLREENFLAYLHGHLHQDLTMNFFNPQNRNPGMFILGAGTFSVDGKDMIPGISQRYNIIDLNVDAEKCKINIQVNTRERANINSHWGPANIYYDETRRNRTNLWKFEVKSY